MRTTSWLTEEPSSSTAHVREQPFGTSSAVLTMDASRKMSCRLMRSAAERKTAFWCSIPGPELQLGYAARRSAAAPADDPHHSCRRFLKALTAVRVHWAGDTPRRRRCSILTRPAKKARTWTGWEYRWGPRANYARISAEFVEGRGQLAYFLSCSLTPKRPKMRACAFPARAYGKSPPGGANASLWVSKGCCGEGNMIKGGAICTYMHDELPALHQWPLAPCPDHKPVQPADHLAGFSGILQIDRYSAYAELAQRR
jgi:hypothetical protein